MQKSDVGLFQLPQTSAFWAKNDVTLELGKPRLLFLTKNNTRYNSKLPDSLCVKETYPRLQVEVEQYCRYNRI